MMPEWATIRLGQVCTKIGSGATPRGGSEVYLENGPYSLIRSQNVYNDGFHREGLAFISESHAAELNNVDVQQGDVLLNITGDSVARACQVDPDVLPARVNQHVAIIRPDPRKLDSSFLRYALVSPEMQARLLMWAGAGATRNALTKGMIESLEVNAPTEIHQQRSIARVLGSLDQKIELNRKTSETLETMARALFKSWFIDFDPVRAKAEGRDHRLPAPIAALFPDSLEDSEFGEIPSGWEVTNWGKLVTLEYGKSLNGYNSENDRFPVYGTNGKIGTCSKPLCPFPGIIIGRKGAYRGIHYSDVPFFVIDTAFYVSPRRPIDLRWAYYSLRRHDINRMDSGSAIPSTSRADFYSLPVIAPPEELQQVFTKTLTPFWARRAHNEQDSNSLADLRNTLLPKLISGELRVRDFPDSHGE